MQMNKINGSGNFAGEIQIFSLEMTKKTGNSEIMCVN